MSKIPENNGFKFSEIKNINEIIHSPARLAILTFLLNKDSVTFSRIAQVLELSRGNLSTHLKKLNENDLVEIEKKFIDFKPTTLISITTLGRQLIKEYAIFMSTVLKDILDKSPK